MYHLQRRHEALGGSSIEQLFVRTFLPASQPRRSRNGQHEQTTKRSFGSAGQDLSPTEGRGQGVNVPTTTAAAAPAHPYPRSNENGASCWRYSCRGRRRPTRRRCGTWSSPASSCAQRNVTKRRKKVSENDGDVGDEHGSSVSTIGTHDNTRSPRTFGSSSCRRRGRSRPAGPRARRTCP
jgi:hypothetical protein